MLVLVLQSGHMASALDGEEAEMMERAIKAVSSAHRSNRVRVSMVIGRLAELGRDGRHQGRPETVCESRVARQRSLPYASRSLTKPQV